MVQFWIFAALMLLVALGFMVVPLLRAQKLPESESNALNVQLAQQKLRELKDEFARGVISQQGFDRAVVELENSLHEDLKAQRAQALDEKSGRWLAIPVLVLVSVLAVVVYNILGDARAFDSTIAKAASQAPPSSADDVNAMVAKLAERLEKEPQDAKGWLMLGRSKMVMKDFNAAVGALRKAQALLGDKPEVLLQLADAVAMANGGTLKGEPGDLIEKALSLEPDSAMGLWLHGMELVESGRYREALSAWATLQKQYQPGEKSYVEVQKLMDGAKARLGSDHLAAGKSAGEIRVKVELAEDLKGKAKPQDTVYIFAQALNGAKAPLAAVKKQVSDLPLELVLDDSMAMMPGRGISSVNDLKLSARISTSGNPMAQPGDFFGERAVKSAERSGIKHILITDAVR